MRKLGRGEQSEKCFKKKRLLRSSLRSWRARDCLREVRAAEPRREWGEAVWYFLAAYAAKTLPSPTMPPATQACVIAVFKGRDAKILQKT